MKTNDPSREIGWENDFYEVLPIVCSPLTADAKVARIKIIFEKLLAAAKAEGGKEMLAKAVEALEKWERDAHENYPDCCKGQCVTYFHAAQIKKILLSLSENKPK